MKVTTYRAKASSCKACELRARCTSNKLGRTLRRGPFEGYLDRVRNYAGTHSYQKALRKRKVWIEPLFAEAKDWHGLRRFRLRSLEKVNIEALLVATGQNVKRLLTFGSHRPKKLAQAAALRPPSATGHEISRTREHRSSHSWWPTKAFFNRLGRFWPTCSSPNKTRLSRREICVETRVKFKVSELDISSEFGGR